MEAINEELIRQIEAENAKMIANDATNDESDNNNNNNNNNNDNSDDITESPETQEEQMKIRSRALIFDNVVHARKQSVFTKLSDDLKLDGFKNFIYLILLIACGRLVFENITTYGFSANPLRWLNYVITNPLSRPTFFLFALQHVYFIVSLVFEKCYVSYLTANQRVTRFSNGTATFITTEAGERKFRAIHNSFLVTMLALPVAVNQMFECNPYLLSFVCLLYSITFLKLYSYHQVNAWWRTGKIYGQPLAEMPNLRRLEEKAENYIENILKSNEESEKKEEEEDRSRKETRTEDPNSSSSPSLILYPQNLNLRNILYYFYVPTLCYQLNFPRTNKIDYWFMARCALEFLFLMELETVLFEQWIVVPLSDRYFTLYNLGLSRFLFRWTKMSLGTVSIWLIGFYALFQSFSNLTAEFLRFADRDFYGDWWNAKTISEFWRLWNLPVHRWCVRHLYKPLVIESNYSRLKASFVIFFASGLFHEFLISVPLGLLSAHFIVGMTMQMVLELATSHVYRTSERLANSIVWLTLIFGQSALILLYYNDLILKLQRLAVIEAVT